MKLIETYKNNWIGSLVGGVSGYYIAKNGMKQTNVYALIGGSLVGALIGSTIQWKINSKVAMDKTKEEILK